MSENLASHIESISNEIKMSVPVKKWLHLHLHEKVVK